jgi:hypothetical protein
MIRAFYIILLLTSFFKQIDAQISESKILTDTTALNQTQVDYLLFLAIDRIFHRNVLNPHFKVPSISDYLWSISPDALYFTFDYMSGEELLMEYEKVRTVNPTHKQDLSLIIPNTIVNYNVAVRYMNSKDQVVPNVESTIHMVHMRVSDLYSKENEVTFFIKTRCKLLHLDQYWENTFRVYASICPYGELYPMKIDSIESIKYERPPNYLSFIDFNHPPCLQYPRESDNRKKNDD